MSHAENDQRLLESLRVRCSNLIDPKFVQMHIARAHFTFPHSSFVDLDEASMHLQTIIDKTDVQTTACVILNQFEKFGLDLVWIYLCRFCNFI